MNMSALRLDGRGLVDLRIPFARRVPYGCVNDVNGRMYSGKSDGQLGPVRLVNIRALGEDRNEPSVLPSQVGGKWRLAYYSLGVAGGRSPARGYPALT